MIVAGVARSRWRLVRNAFRRRGGRAGHPLIGIALALLLGALVFAAFATLFGTLADTGTVAAEAGAILALVLFGALAALLVFDLHYVVSAVLLDSDLDLIRRAPVTPAALLMIKLVDALPRTSALLMVLALPAVIAFGVAWPLPAWAWALLPIQLGALWAVALGLGTALALALVRYVPARRARDILGLLSTLLVMLLWLANSFLLPRLAGNENDLRRIGEAIERGGLAAALSPPAWIANGLVAAAVNEGGRALKWTALLVFAGVTAIGVAAGAAALFLETALAHVSIGPGRRATSRSAPAVARRPRARGLIAAVIVRDARLFARDWTVLSDVLTAAALWTLLPLVAAPAHAAPPLLLARAMLLALTVGLGYEVAARSVPFERAGLAWSKLAPVPPTRWVAGKLAGAAALSLPLLAFAASIIGISFRLDPGQWIETTVLGFSALGLSLALGLWSGFQFGNPEWTNPRAMLTLTGRLVATGLLLAQASVWLGLVVLADRYRNDLAPSFTLWVPPAISALLGLLTLSSCARQLERREWSG